MSLMMIRARVRDDHASDSPLPRIPAFLEFQATLKGWLAEPPTAEPLEVVGSYRLFG